MTNTRLNSLYVVETAGSKILKSFIFEVHSQQEEEFRALADDLCVTSCCYLVGQRRDCTFN